MPTTEIKNKVSSRTAITVTGAASLADGSGYEFAAVDNTTNKYDVVEIGASFTCNGTPTANQSVDLYFLRNNGTEYDEGASGSAASWSPIGKQPDARLLVGSSPSSGQVLEGLFIMAKPGRSWQLAIVNNSGVALSSTGGDHSAGYVGMLPEIQA